MRRSKIQRLRAAGVAVAAFVAWTVGDGAAPLEWMAAVVAVAAVVSVPALRGGWAFAANGLAIAAALVMLFAGLYPDVLVSSIDPAFNLTLGNAASGSYALTAITVVAALMVPAVLAAQVWTYWVFRRRVEA